MRISLPPVDASVLIEDLAWDTFLGVLDDLGEHRSARVAYQDGQLEIMSPSRRHERIRKLLGLFVHLLAEELGVEIGAAGSTTLLRADLQRGVEADECFYVTHEAVVRGSDELDLRSDPAPDLAIEVDITRKSLDRMPIYAALGIGELWRYAEPSPDAGELLIYRLVDGAYEEVEKSTLFPAVRIRELPRFVPLLRRMDDTGLARALREWLRTR